MPKPMYLVTGLHQPSLGGVLCTSKKSLGSSGNAHPPAPSMWTQSWCGGTRPSQVSVWGQLPGGEGASLSEPAAWQRCDSSQPGDLLDICI